MSDLFLIYVNYKGKDYKGNDIYEFLFSDSIEKIDGEEWDMVPAAGRPKPPYEKFINHTGELVSELTFDLIQDSSNFAVWDAVDGVISLAWENVDNYMSYPEHRLFFRFGEPKGSVEAKLYEKDLILLYNDKKNEKQK